ncbi:UPF0489 protein C5orf22 homolog [Anthophora plagiata]
MRDGGPAEYKLRPPGTGLVAVLTFVACLREMPQLLQPRVIVRAYKQSEIDWKIIHDAGCTRDDTDLPDHVTKPNDLDRLISGTFRSFLAALPCPPTIVTIARSSEDEYCPMEDVDQIQFGVLEELRQRLGEIDIRLAYQEEETL